MIITRTHGEAQCHKLRLSDEVEREKSTVQLFDNDVQWNASDNDSTIGKRKETIRCKRNITIITQQEKK